MATLEWVDWFNHERLLAPLGYVPPAECEAQYSDAQGDHTTVAVVNLTSLLKTRGDSLGFDNRGWSGHGRNTGVVNPESAIAIVPPAVRRARARQAAVTKATCRQGCERERRATTHT